MAKLSEETKQKFADTFDIDNPGTDLSDVYSWMTEKMEEKGKMPRKEQPTKLVFTPPPRLMSFSGDESAKGTDYDTWAGEVGKLEEDPALSATDTLTAVKKSLQGRAHKVVKRLGHEASLQTVLQKLEMKFGNMQKGRLVMKLFYAAEQKPGEDVASWAARLEDLMDQAVELGKVTEQDQNDLLKEQFWNGLRDELQEGTEHKYDTIKSFDDLEVYIREVKEKRKDKEKKTSSLRGAGARVKATANMSQQESSSEMAELKAMFKSMVTEVAELKKEMKQVKESRLPAPPTATSGDERRCYVCDDPSHLSFDCPQRRRDQGYRQDQSYRQERGYRQGRGSSRGGRRGDRHAQQPLNSQSLPSRDRRQT